jgi:hypothetical protein
MDDGRSSLKHPVLDMRGEHGLPGGRSLERASVIGHRESATRSELERDYAGTPLKSVRGRTDRCDNHRPQSGAGAVAAAERLQIRYIQAAAITDSRVIVDLLKPHPSFTPRHAGALSLRGYGVLRHVRQRTD